MTLDDKTLKQRVRQKASVLMETRHNRLPEETLRNYVSRFISQKERYLGVIQQEGSPLYLFEKQVLEARVQSFREAFQSLFPETSFYYAVKSNHHPEVAAHLAAKGFGLDVSSGLELELGLKTGCNDLIFSGPGKTEQELSLAVSHADRVVILMDSLLERSRLERVSAQAGKRVRAGVRICVNDTGLWRKFGIPLKSIFRFLEESDAFPHVRVEGLQFHTSWNLSPDQQCAFIEKVGAEMGSWPRRVRERLSFIDIGGGYWPEMGEWLQGSGTPQGALLNHLGIESGNATTHYFSPSRPISDFAGQLSRAIHQHIFPHATVRVCFEPGRWIVNDAMHLLFTVLDKKGEDLVITDAGTNAVGWERFETDYFPVINLSRPALTEKACLITGALCTPHDIWGYGYFGDGIEPGDLLMVPTQGAYTYSLRQNFIKPLPRAVFI